MSKSPPLIPPDIGILYVFFRHFSGGRIDLISSVMNKKNRATSELFLLIVPLQTGLTVPLS